MLRRGFEGEGEDLGDIVDEVERHVLTHSFGDVVDVGLVRVPVMRTVSVPLCVP